MIILYNDVVFREKFQAFADVNTYPQSSMEQFFSAASLYISDQAGGCYCGGMTEERQTQALYLMTAHLAYISNSVMSGGNQGFVSGATIDKVSVTITPPPFKNQWQWWLSSTPYGQQLLALLQIVGVGGCYYGGRNELGAFRRIGF